MTAGFMHSICSSRCVHARTPRCTCTACGGAAHGTLPAEHAEQLELFAAEVIVPRRSSFPAAGPGEPDPQAGGPPIAGHRRTSPCPSLSHVAPDPAAAGPSSREAAGAGLGPIPQEPVSSTLPPATISPSRIAHAGVAQKAAFPRYCSRGQLAVAEEQRVLGAEVEGSNPSASLIPKAGPSEITGASGPSGLAPSGAAGPGKPAGALQCRPTAGANPPNSQRKGDAHDDVAGKARVESMEPIPPVVAPDDGDAPARRRGRTSLVGGQPNGNTGAGSPQGDLRIQPGLATPAGKQSHKKPGHSRGPRFAGDDRDETSGVPGVRQGQLAGENTSVSALQPSNLGHLAATDVPQQDVPGRHGRPANALPSDAPANPGPQGVPAPDAAGGAAPTIHSHPDPSSTHSTAAAPGSGGRPSRLCACGRRAKWGSTRCRICDPWKPLANLRGMAVHP